MAENDDPYWAYWELSGPRKYLNIPSPVPDRWRAELTYGSAPPYKTVVAWGPTEEAARQAAIALAQAQDNNQQDQ